MNKTQDINYHPNNFFIGLEENKDFPYKETIQRQIKKISEQKLINAYKFEIEQFPEESQMDTQAEMYLGGLETWLYDREFWKTANIYDAFNLFMNMARANTYFFKKYHKKNPNKNSSQKSKNECFALYQLTTLYFSLRASQKRSIRKTMGIRKGLFG
jgi:hypothetical protein|tara:strand:- start:74 stop:544 length:471 start_codon:yes stop_codon:yes gene_type:complete